MDFIRQLPKRDGTYAVPFVTYGGVSSGTGLYEMASLLRQRGFSILGAAKVLAVHSMMWKFENPLGEGHPNDEDARMIMQLVKSVCDKMSRTGSIEALKLEKLNYQTQENQEIAKKRNLEALKKSLPSIKVNNDACTQCYICQENCPVQNITFNPFPQFGESCIFCFNCIRTCETGAIYNDVLGFIETEVKNRASAFAEPLETRIFF